MARYNIHINLIGLLANILALTMAYQMWGWKGCLFTVGLLLSNQPK